MAKKKATTKKTTTKKTTKKKATTKRKSAPDLEAVFEALRDLLKEVAASNDLVVVQDTSNNIWVNVKGTKRRQPQPFFGSVRKMKGFVSFFLGALYLWPDLHEHIPPALKKHLKGESCFNFNAVDTKLFGELAKLAVLARRTFETRPLPTATPKHAWRR